MSLFNLIKEERIAALKQKLDVKKNILGVLIGEASKNDKEPSDAVIISTIKKFINNIDITLAHLDPTSKTYAENSLQKDFLSSYLPKQLPEEELKTIISDFMWHETTTEVGKIQKYLKENYAGLYDGKVVNILIKEIINESSGN
jgi:uncharacterized protein YqeY